MYVGCTTFLVPGTRFYAPFLVNGLTRSLWHLILVGSCYSLRSDLTTYGRSLAVFSHQYQPWSKFDDSMWYEISWLSKSIDRQVFGWDFVNYTVGPTRQLLWAIVLKPSTCQYANDLLRRLQEWVGNGQCLESLTKKLSEKQLFLESSVCFVFITPSLWQYCYAYVCTKCMRRREANVLGLMMWKYMYV